MWCMGKPFCLRFNNGFLFFAVNGETTVQQNGGPLSSVHTTEPPGTDYVVIDLVPRRADAPVTPAEVPGPSEII